jgi:hypothetical protein
LKTPLTGRWQDLRFSRLLLGLAVAPIIPTILTIPMIAAILYHDDKEAPPAFIGVACAIAYVLLAVIWSILAGLVALYTVSRSRGKLGRRGCMAMGSICSILFLIVMTLCGGVAFESDFRGFLAEAFVQMTAVFALPAALLGMLGGWIFWRFSVRPVASSMTELAPVFD